jgi:hypothetical protein
MPLWNCRLPSLYSVSLSLPQAAKARPQHIMALARHLGIDPVFDTDLLWIAEKARLAPPPSSSLSPSLPLCLPLLSPSPSLSLCLSHCRIPHHLSHYVSHWCLPHRLSHCVSHCCLPPHLSHCVSPSSSQAFDAPLPGGWSAHHDAGGNEYYYNATDGTTCWEHPMEAHFRSLALQQMQEKERKKAIERNLGKGQVRATPRTTPRKMDTNCTARSLIPTVTGNTVRSCKYARTTVRSPRKLNHCLALTTSN